MQTFCFPFHRLNSVFGPALVLFSVIHLSLSTSFALKQLILCYSGASSDDQ